jgi:hypothetical protein
MLACPTLKEGDSHMREENHEVVTEEEVTSARHVGLWKILAGSLIIVVIGFAVVAGFTSNPA